MEIKQEMIDKGAEALMESVIGKALKLREVEARSITEIVLRAEVDAHLIASVVVREENLVFSTRADAEAVLSSMGDLLQKDKVVFVSDLKDLSGIPSTHKDTKSGWKNLAGARVGQVREGWVLVLPNAVQIQ